MELNDWILALHLLAAFAYVGATALFWCVVLALWRCDDTGRIASFFGITRLGTVLVSIGSLGTIVFGIWLAVSLDAFQLWDAWVIIAIVLWAIASETGRRAGNAYGAGLTRAIELQGAGTSTSPELAETFGAGRGLWLHVVSTVTLVVLLADMIWKPWA